ncbi:MAG: HAD-IIA family hydrolase [Bryobacteraceae bacterium]|nr:HAD-IIA family hydrolase [Bryobacteraceae bacterium]
MNFGCLLDMDGVIYRGSEVIPGAPEFIRYLTTANIPYLFLTNNSAPTQLDILLKLKKFGIETTQDHIYTSAMATAEWVVRQKPDASAYVIGENGLLSALNEARIPITRDKPDFVIVGEGRTLNFEMLEIAHRAIDAGAGFVSTNADTWCPTDAGPRPGCGAIAACLQAATGIDPYHVGKPNPFMFRAARKKLDLSTDEVLMIGDTMETDIRGATDLGFKNILVLTGSTPGKELDDYAFRPTLIVDSIASLVPPTSSRKAGNAEAILGLIDSLRKRR